MHVAAAIAALARFHSVARMRGDQVLEFRETVAARVEVGGKPLQVAADRTQVRPALVVGGRIDGFGQQRIELGIALEP